MELLIKQNQNLNKYVQLIEQVSTMTNYLYLSERKYNKNDNSSNGGKNNNNNTESETKQNEILNSLKDLQCEQGHFLEMIYEKQTCHLCKKKVDLNYNYKCTRCNQWICEHCAICIRIKRRAINDGGFNSKEELYFDRYTSNISQRV